MAHITKQENLKISYQFINWILQNNRGIMGHLYKFTSVNGVNDYFTDLDIDINYDQQLWKSGSLRFDGLQRKIGIGLNVDEQNLKIWAAPTDTLYGGNFLSGAEQGLLDGSILVRYRAIWAFASGNAAADVNQEPIAVWPLFTGYTSTISKGGGTHIELKVKSALLKLNVNMPRNYWQPGCLWTLFDQGCTLDKAIFAGVSSVGPNATPVNIPVVGGMAVPIAADGIQNYAQGRLLFTSGALNGLQVLIDANDAVQLYLAYPLDEVPAPGDTITFYPGCSKSYFTCGIKFANQANHRGFDKVPPIMMSL